MSTATTPQRSAAAAPALQAGRQPLYVALARTLLQDIAKGRYAVGHSLPTESELSLRHGVSRHTVRQALRELKDEGVVWARPGIGTKVRARPDIARFFSGIQSITDLLQFVEATEMHVRGRRELVADEHWATTLRCAPGQAWSEIDIVRKVPGTAQPLSYLQVYLRPEFTDAVGDLTVLRQPIYSLVEARYGVRIVEVLQEVTAAGLTATMAQALDAAEGQPALRISRFYLDRSGAIVEVGVGHYPSGRFTQSTRFRAQGAQADMSRVGYGTAAAGPATTTGAPVRRARRAVAKDAPTKAAPTKGASTMGASTKGASTKATKAKAAPKTGRSRRRP